MKKYTYLTYLVILLSFLSHSLGANAIRSGFNGDSLLENDDKSTALIELPFEVNFYGVNYSSAYVNNNGNITFDEPLSDYHSSSLLASSRAIIAPFFSDVDTRGSFPSLRSLFPQYIPGIAQYGSGVADERAAWGATWTRVEPYHHENHQEEYNSFQLLLIDRSETGLGNFDIEFNYDLIMWDTGDYSNSSSARVGFSNGLDAAFELDGSGKSGSFLDGGAHALINHSLHSEVDGRYIFSSRNGVVTTSVVPEPSSVAFLAIIALFGRIYFRKRS